MWIGINFFQTPVNVGIWTSSHESQVFLMASRMANPFQKVFNFLCPHPSEESLSMAAMALQNVFFYIMRLEGQNDSLIHWLKNKCCVDRHENINLLVYFHQSYWVTRGIVNEQ